MFKRSPQAPLFIQNNQARMSEDIEELRKRKSLPKFGWDEIVKHNTSESLWLVINDKIYDVTEFMEEVRSGLTLVWRVFDGV